MNSTLSKPQLEERGHLEEHSHLEEHGHLEEYAHLVPAHALTGHYRAKIQNTACELHLRLNPAGCLTGTFCADGQILEILGGIPSLYGEVYGQMRDNTSGEVLAVFRAMPQMHGVQLELDLPNTGDIMKLANAEEVIFTRF
jgi:hypothetical protein